MKEPLNDHAKYLFSGRIKMPGEDPFEEPDPFNNEYDGSCSYDDSDPFDDPNSSLYGEQYDAGFDPGLTDKMWNQSC